MQNSSYILIVSLALLVACQQGESGEEDISTDLVTNPLTASGGDKKDKTAIISFENDSYDFGKIIQGEKITHSYSFKNTGTAPLVISSVAASCGCTIPTWEKNPIAAGESGEINVVFDSEGKRGAQAKDITVITNALPNTSILRLTGEVVVP